MVRFSPGTLVISRYGAVSFWFQAWGGRGASTPALEGFRKRPAGLLLESFFGGQLHSVVGNYPCSNRFLAPIECHLTEGRDVQIACHTRMRQQKHPK